MQELAYGLANAVGVLDAVRDSGQVPPTSSPRSSAGSRSSSTRASGSSRRCARCARSPRCGTASASSATACTDEKLRRFRYGMQVNSLGLTEEQPENNVQRIVLEMLGVTLSQNARARAVQLPVLERGARAAAAVGPAVVAADAAGARVRDPTCSSTATSSRARRSSRRRSTSCRTAAWDELALGPRRRRLVRDDRRDQGPARAVQRRARPPHRVGRDARSSASTAFTETEPSPLTASLEGESHILVLDPAAEAEQIDAARGVAAPTVTPPRSSRR